MFKEVFTTLFLTITITANFLMAEVQYEIQDIDTLQTKSSQAIALNNQGQILGWYNIDGTNEGKHFFVRNRDGSFFEVPKKENGIGLEINWSYLTNNGKVYGTFDGNKNFAVLYMWDQYNGVVKLGNLPGKEISAINDAGQVLIKSVIENENGISVRRPVIWHNGIITKLNGVDGNAGIQSDESYGLNMNNKGEVVGQSIANLIYKNTIYKQTHAVKWINGHAIDLHKTVPKSSSSSASSINDLSEVIIGRYLICNDGQVKLFNHFFRTTSENYLYDDMYVFDKKGMEVTNGYAVSNKMLYDLDSIWMTFDKIISVNDNGEIIAHGETVWGEKHAMLLTPVSSD